MRQRFYKDEETYARKTYKDMKQWNVMDAAESRDDRQHKKEAYVVLARVEKFIHCCLAPKGELILGGSKKMVQWMITHKKGTWIFLINSSVTRETKCSLMT